MSLPRSGNTISCPVPLTAWCQAPSSLLNMRQRNRSLEGYVTNAAGERLTYYLLQPPVSAAHQKHPMVLGMMAEGDKGYTWERFAQAIASCGAYFVCMDRRGRSGPQGAEDVFCAYEFLSTRFAVDRNNLYLFGICAGGNLAEELLVSRPEIWKGAMLFSTYPFPRPGRVRAQSILLDVGGLDVTGVDVDGLAVDQQDIEKGKARLAGLLRSRDELAAAGIRPILIIHPGVGHFAENDLFGEGKNETNRCLYRPALRDTSECGETSLFQHCGEYSQNAGWARSGSFSMEKLIRAYIYSAGALLLAMATALFLARIRQTPLDFVPLCDPVLNLPLPTLFGILGAVLLILGLFCIFGGQATVQLTHALWLSLNLMVYGLSLPYMGVKGGLKGYLGEVADVFGVSTSTMATLLAIAVWYLFLGSSIALIMVWASERIRRANPRIKMACAQCGGHIDFSLRNAGQEIPCPHCQATITLRKPDLLAMSCFFCQGHIKFPNSRAWSKNLLPTL